VKVNHLSFFASIQEEGGNFSAILPITRGKETVHLGKERKKARALSFCIAEKKLSLTFHLYAYGKKREKHPHSPERKDLQTSL